MNRSPYQDICTFFSSRRLQLIPSGARNLLGISHRVGRNAGSSGRQMYRPWAGQARGNISMLQDRWRIPSMSALSLHPLWFLESGGPRRPPRREKTGPERTSRAVSPLEYALTKTKDLNPPGMNTYKRRRGGLPASLLPCLVVMQPSAQPCRYSAGRG